MSVGVGKGEEGGSEGGSVDDGPGLIGPMTMRDHSAV